MERKINTNYLNGIRPILAFWVAYGHLYKYLGGKMLFNCPIISNLLIGNGPAVDGFMLITGFLMMYHYVLRIDKESPYKLTTVLKFWVRRLFRLYPLYIIGLLAAFFLLDFNRYYVSENYKYFTGKNGDFSATFDLTGKSDFINLFLHGTFLHGLFPKYNVSILGPAWSLSTEMQFYFIFPFLFLLFCFGKVKFYSRVTIISILSVFITFVTVRMFGYWDIPGKFFSFGAPSLIIHKISYFVFGMVLAITAMKKIPKWPMLFWLFTSVFFQAKIVSLLLFIITFYMFSDEILVFFPNWIQKVFTGSKNLLSGKIASFGSDISYSIYLLHMVIMPGILHFVIINLDFSRMQNAIIGTIIFTIISVIMSYALYLIVEKPFIKLGKNIIFKIFKNN